MPFLNHLIKVSITVTVLIICICAATGCINSGSMSVPEQTIEADDKAAYREVPIGDLMKSPEKYKGQQVKYTGEIISREHVLNLNPDNSSIASVGDCVAYEVLVKSESENASVTRPNLHVNIKQASFKGFGGLNKSSINGYVTIYGRLNGTYSPYYKGSIITLPRIDAEIIEKSP